MPLLCSKPPSQSSFNGLQVPEQPSNSPQLILSSILSPEATPALLLCLNTTKMLPSQGLHTCCSLCPPSLSLLSTCFTPSSLPCSDIILSSLTNLLTLKPLKPAACYPPSLLYFSLEHLPPRILFVQSRCPINISLID